jgi:competence protein ComEC
MKKKLTVLMVCALVLCFTGSSVKALTRHAPLPRLQVIALDVGHGQSFIIISPLGKVAVIDAGPAGKGEAVVAALRKRNIRNIELVVATQPDARYIGGMRRVLLSSDFSIKTFLDSGQPSSEEAYKQMLSAASTLNLPVTPAARGQLFDLGGGVRLDVYNPAGGGRIISTTASSASPERANPIVLRLLFRDFAMLFMSGAHSGTEEDVINSRHNVWAPVLAVGDQGSSAATGERFLSLVRPKAAIISVGAGSDKALPAGETLERLLKGKTEIYRTDQHGEIIISSDGKDFQVTAERKT